MLLLLLVPLAACNMATMAKQLTNEYNEQLYVDARLGFAIKHPLDWQRQQVPVSEPNYRADTVLWQIKELEQQTSGSGAMLIRSQPSAQQNQPADLLTDFLSDQPELKSGQAEPFTHPAGEGLRLLGNDDQRGRLTIAIKGSWRDFIISLDYPVNRFDELLYIFEDIVASFVEIDPAAAKAQ